MKKTLSSILFLSALLVAVISTTALAAFHDEFPFAVYNCLSRTPIYSDEELTDIIGYGEIGDELLIYEELDSAFRIRFNGSFAYVPYGDFMEHDFELPRGTFDCCTEGAEFIHTCGSCGYEFVEIIPPFAHAWVLQSATFFTNCEDDTSEIYVCSVCGEKKIEVIPALGHNLEVTYVLLPGQQSICEYGAQKIIRCLRAGCTYYDMELIPGGHNFEEVTRVEPTFQSSGTATMQCTYCGFREYITIPALVDDGMTDDFFFARSNILDWRLEIVRDLRPRFRLHLWRNDARCCISQYFAVRSHYDFRNWRTPFRIYSADKQYK